MPKNVLIVDDEKVMLLVMQKSLEAYHDSFTVLVASDGEEALAILRQVEVSLVVTDMIMPHMDGLTLLVHIRSDFPHIPVIIMTAHNRPVMERMASKIGVAEYIEKPFDMEELAEKIKVNLMHSAQAKETGIRDMTVGMFVQLIELEKRSCEIELLDVPTQRHGTLSFENGKLVGGLLEDLPRDEAVREMLSWGDVTIFLRKGEA